jgi:hydrogenase nickel incorporation protein HypA/HybF
MHEMTVVVNIVNTMDRYARINGIPEVKGVLFQVGALSGVIPHYVHECWLPAIDRSQFLKNSSVDIEEIPAIGRCNNCSNEFDIPENKGICSKCNVNEWTLISGKEVIIKEIYIM